MNLVQEALMSQRRIWREVAGQILKDDLSRTLPLKAPKRILFFGVGSSFFSAKLTASTLIRESIRSNDRLKVEYLACNSLSIGVEVVPRQSDWVFAFSHRGQTPVTLKALQLCQQAGAYTVLVAAKNTPTSSYATLQLSTSELEKCEPHTQGMTSAICAATSLLLGTKGTEAWTRLSEDRDPELESLKSKVGLGPSLVLGEWEGEWVAREISLKLSEIAELRIPAFGSEEYFHGPHLLSAKQKDPERIWHACVTGDPREGQIQPSHRASVVLDRPLGWVNALVEFQWMALAVALNRNIL